MTAHSTSFLNTALVIATLTFTGAAAAQVYKVTDEKNGVIFTDQPPTVNSTSGQSVEQIDIPETNRAIAPEPSPQRATGGTVREEPEAEIAPQVAITAPANETTIAMGPGNFAVSARGTPPLNSGERFVLLMDGQPVGSPQNSDSWFLEGVLRGPHDLVVQRTSSRGQVIASSDPVRVYVLRPSIIRR